MQSNFQSYSTSRSEVDVVSKIFWEELALYIDVNAQTRIQNLCEQTGESIPVTISQLGLAPDQEVSKAYAVATGVPVWDVDNRCKGASHDINVQFLKSNRALAFTRDGDDILKLAMVDPINQSAINGVTFATGYMPQISVIGLSDWRAEFERLYGSDELAEDGDDSGQLRWADDATRLKDMASEAPVIRRVEALLTKAVDMGASDIHVEPSANATRIRYRVDGVMQAPLTEAAGASVGIISRIKVMSDMDVADTRRPQDGRTSIAVRGRPIDLRVSTVPTSYGESLVIRLLDRTAALLSLGAIGFSDHDLDVVNAVLERPRGIFLVTGPTGSGKTTTLYAALNKLRETERKILTVEDPVEYYFDDVNQVQVNEAAGVTFATSLRSFLRQDPDIMLVGEIRDEETARIAIQAALTGHLVLSTLHTNDAVSAVTRLKDMGIEDYLIASTVSGVLAQRLVRKLCAQCGGQGCAACEQSGYAGRLAISEGFAVDSDIRELIQNGASEAQILKAAKSKGMTSLRDDGAQKADCGLAKLDDVYAAVGAL